MKYLFFFFSLILFFNSCSKDDDSIDNPLYINGSFNNITFNEDNILGDSIEITLYYTIEDQGYSFYELTYTKLEGEDENLIDNFLIELKLVNDGKTEETVQNSITWKFFPTLEGSYGINYINTSGDTIQEILTAEYNITKINEHTMINEDYQIIVDSVINNPDLEQYVDVYRTGEDYYGADAYYANFVINIANRIAGGQTEYEGLSEEAALNLVWERLIEGIEIFLKEKYPTNKYEKFIIQFETYNLGSYQEYKAEFISKEINNKIEFEYHSKELVDK